ncbi:MAG: phage tail protein [[Pasteurella] aerogenes]|nr:phage tail protein [[Pasteurella] aerogenes]
MYALDNKSGVSVMPEIKSQVSSPDEPLWFTEGGNGVAPSYPGADWFNIVQAELLNVIKAGALGANKTDLNQLAIAIQSMIDKTNASNLTLKKILIGIPFPYPLSAVPSGCLAFNGQTFNKTTYPILAQKYPSGVLPDLRGEFIRFLDNGRGVDGGRALLSSQTDTMQRLTGSFNIRRSAHNNTEMTKSVEDAAGIFRYSMTTNRLYNAIQLKDIGADGMDVISFDSSLTGRTSTENRPRNIAFQAICLAA